MPPVFFIFEIDCFVAGSFLIVKEKHFFYLGGVVTMVRYCFVSCIML
jgi:hypothetical protein